MCAPVIFSPGQSSGTPGGYGVTGRAQTRPSAAAGWTLPVCENHASRTLITRSAGGNGADRDGRGISSRRLEMRRRLRFRRLIAPFGSEPVRMNTTLRFVRHLARHAAFAPQRIGQLVTGDVGSGGAHRQTAWVKRRKMILGQCGEHGSVLHIGTQFGAGFRRAAVLRVTRPLGVGTRKVNGCHNGIGRTGCAEQHGVFAQCAAVHACRGGEERRPVP